MCSAQLLPQLGQMIQAEPKTAPFCGELLKFATAPFRAGRSLDGAIDELIEQMKTKGEQPAGDDPTTAAGKIALQVEQMKQQTAKEKNAQDARIKEQEMAQKDRHKTWELNNAKEIERIKLGAKAGDDAGQDASAEPEGDGEPRGAPGAHAGKRAEDGDRPSESRHGGAVAPGQAE